MDHHEFKSLCEKVKQTLTEDANEVLALLKGVKGLSITEKMDLVEIIVTGYDAGMVTKTFVPDMFGNTDLANVARMALGRILQSNVSEILSMYVQCSDTQKEVCAVFISDIIDPVSVNELLKGSSVAEVCKLIDILLDTGGDRTKEKLIEFVTTENRSLQIEAVKLLGEKGNEFSIEVLIDSIEKDEALGILIVNQLSKVKSDSAVQGLITLLGINNVKIRSFVEKRVENMGRDIVPQLNQVIEQNGTNANLLISALGLITKFKDKESLKSVKRLVNYFHDNANVRAAAYMALAAIDAKSGAPLLVDALRDPVDDVAFVAARALERACNDFIIDGVINVMQSHVYPVERLVEVLLFTESDTILNKTIHLDDVVKALNTLCSYVGMEHYREKYATVVTTGISVDEKSGRGLVWAIDDAPSVLNMYERFCIKSGLPIKTFESPKSPLSLIKNTKPDVIFVDLNMPDVDGISFTKEVREYYSKEELPIILVTTQEGVSEDQNLDKEHFSEIIYKPFNEEALRGVTESIFSKLVY